MWIQNIFLKPALIERSTLSFLIEQKASVSAFKSYLKVVCGTYAETK